MSTSGNIHTVSDNHSIKEAIISFIVSSNISNPRGYSKLLEKEGALYSLYHKFEPIKQVEVKISKNDFETKVQNIEDSGFKLVSFKEGKITDIIQGINQNRQGVFTFNTINYLGWEQYSSSVLNAAKAIANYNENFSVIAFSLLYIDEFFFKSAKDYNPKEIFNLRSSRLPKGIEDSEFVDFNLNLKKQKEEKKFVENLSVKVFDIEERKIINITNNITFSISPTPFIDLLNNDDLKIFLNFVHEENKGVLRDILNNKIINSIGL